MPIRVLDPEVAQRIAAGEVVERPSSAVKELVENALDAGASQVQVEIRSGGLGLIRVADDGAGIPAAEAELAFQRHATSKLSQVADLASIHTLGFRGEALASIAAVSQIVLYTRHQSEELGVSLTLEAGQVVERKPWAGASGTAILVRNLFFNVPARLKFLRTATSEAGQIGHVVEQFALGHPETRFRFVNDGRRVLEAPGSGDLRDAARQVYGAEIADAMVAIDETSETSHARIWGLIGTPALTRANRSGLSFFVNRRWINNLSLGYAVEEAYRPALLPGRHPIVALHLELPPSDVDCNVHPTKADVRIANDRLVYSAAHRAVRAVLLEAAPLPEVGAPLAPAAWPGAGDWLEQLLAPAPARDVASPPRPLSTGGGEGEPGDAPGVSVPSPLAISDGEGRGGEATPFRPTTLRPIGQVQNTYIVAEGAGGVYFIDQHTAHERVLYEEIVAQRAAPDAPSQALLAPLVVPLSAAQRAALAERGDALVRLGFRLDEFGPDAYVLRAVPPRLARADLARALREAADVLAGDAVASDGTDRLCATLACHSAVRAGDPLTMEEIARLLARLEATDVSRYCPHGRPVVIQLSVTQLERDFHRR
ncbi:MAG: DNA mismatch repair endonuclease MutL [Chloroflexota bacterium]